VSWVREGRPHHSRFRQPPLASKGPNRPGGHMMYRRPRISPSPCVPVSPRVPGSLRLPATPRVPAAPAARARLRLLPAHPSRRATADRWWAGPGRQARTSRACGSQASRSAVAVGPPGRMTPEQLAPGAGLEVNQAAEVDPVAGAGGARTTVSRRPAARIEGDCYSLSEAWQQQARLIG
jgi:hypothetical protein